MEITQDIINHVFDIIGVKNRTFVLYDLDNDFEKQDKLYEFYIRIRRDINDDYIKHVYGNKRVQRPYISFIKAITEKIYDMVSEDYKFMLDPYTLIRTRKYIFIKKHVTILKLDKS